MSVWLPCNAELAQSSNELSPWGLHRRAHEADLARNSELPTATLSVVPATDTAHGQRVV